MIAMLKLVQSHGFLISQTLINNVKLAFPKQEW